MRHKKHFVRRVPPANWLDDVTVIWEEDDATRMDPSAEKPMQAYARITGEDFSSREVVDEADMGDGSAKLMMGGWVFGYTCEGGFVGVYSK
jgi:hypothetical protein